MGITAKFWLQSITETTSGFNVVLQPVTDGSDDNRQWSKYTPSGRLEMSITNDEALPFFTDLFRRSKAASGPDHVKPEVILTLEYAQPSPLS